MSTTDYEPQMMADEFIAEVIQIVAPSKIHFDIKRHEVRLEFRGRSVDDYPFETVVYAKTIGQCMRGVREELRRAFGK